MLILKTVMPNNRNVIVVCGSICSTEKDMEMYVLNLVDYQVKGWMTWKRDSKWAK